MPEDLDPLLKEWPFEPGAIQARKIQGTDGRVRFQLRVDLGILQMEIDGRPDGKTIMGCESLLDHYEKLAARAKAQGHPKAFHLTHDDCMKLQLEGVQYYHRYLVFFHLEHYDEVVRDTQRNLRLFDFVTDHAEKPETAASFQQFRPYVLMMLTRAQAMMALKGDDYILAIKHVEWGLEQIREFLQEHYPPEALPQNQELRFLENFLGELRERRPITVREKMVRQMKEAIRKEEYERAARLRDALRELSPRDLPPPTPPHDRHAEPH